MKRFSGLLSRSKNANSYAPSTFSSVSENTTDYSDNPESNASRAVRLFCESGSTNNRDEEVLHLPTIVDAAESSPQAAAACAAQIRAFLHKQYMSKPHIQYNAIMLIRILSDHPGEVFTRNFDDKFVKTVKTVLKESADSSTQQILRETLDALEGRQITDAGVQNLIAMWRKEKGQAASLAIPEQRHRSMGFGLGRNRQSQSAPPPLYSAPSYSSQRSQNGRTHLPPPQELASRVEESRNTAKILVQLLQTTPPEELSANDLIKEFADRCQSASRSMQTYINCDSPAPDHNTLQTLIETNEQLSLAISRYQRALLASRRATGSNPSANQRAASISSQPSGHIYQPEPQRVYHSYQHPVSPPQPQTGFSPPLQANGFSPSPLLEHERRTSNSGFSGSGVQQTQYPMSASALPRQYAQPPLQQAMPSPPLSIVRQASSRSHPQTNMSISSQAPSQVSEPFDDLYDSPSQQRQRPEDNPFMDPADRSAVPTPLAVEPTHYGNSFSSQNGNERRSDLENAYSNSPIQSSSNRSSPRMSFSSQHIQQHTSAITTRPGIGPWHTSSITPSFLGRQESAANGLTMHAPGTPAAIPEIDSDSHVGRDLTPTAHTPRATGLNRVDVPGTGGLRAA